MPNNLHVTLDKSTTPWRLDIDQKDHANQVDRDPQKQTITWQLSGEAASGSFDAQTDPQPGFAWLEPPPDGIFGNPGPGSNPNQITMSDFNHDASTAGTWTYQLAATIDGVVYQSGATSITGTTTNPWIKNK